MPIDWNSLAPGHDLGHGEARRVAARQAVSDVLGPDEMAAAVDASLNRGPGSDLAAAVLELLQPTAAMDRCLETLDRDDPPRRRGAAELLARISDVHVADRLEGLLADADPSVAAAGAGLLHRLVWTGALPAATSTALVDVCLAHDVPRVRVIGLDIAQSLHARDAIDTATIERMFEAADDDPDPAVREAARQHRP